MTPYEALYRRLCRSLLYWVEPNEHVTMGPQIIEETTKMVHAICKRLKAVQSRQKSYANMHQMEVEFNVGDYVFLKVSPMGGVTRFGIKGKLELRYIRWFEIIKRIDDVANRLNLPPQLDHVHDIFHVNMPKKYTLDLSYVLSYKKSPFEPNVTYEEQPIEILAREIHRLHNKETPMVKMRRDKHSKKDVTWELESDMYEK